MADPNRRAEDRVFSAQAMPAADPIEADQAGRGSRPARACRQVKGEGGLSLDSYHSLLNAAGGGLCASHWPQFEGVRRVGWLLGW